MRRALMTGALIVAFASAGGAGSAPRDLSPCAAGSGPLAFTVQAPAWSPDGKQVAFAREYFPDFAYYRIFTITPEVTRLRAISPCTQTLAGGRFARLAWSPDGSRLLAAESPPAQGNGRISVVAADGSAASLLAEGEHPDWSPDGKAVVFERGGFVYVIPSSGGSERRIAAGTFPDWSPDGSEVAFAQDGVRTVSPAGVEERRITAAGVNPAWSPDGKWIALVERSSNGDARVVVVRRDGTGRRVLGTEPGAPSFAVPRWLPEGSAVAMPPPVVHLYPLRGEPRAITAGVRLRTRDVSFAPDGERFVAGTLACSALSMVVVVQLATGNVRQLAHDCYFFGSWKGERMVGSNLNDEIFGMGGDDRLYGRGGSDVLLGERGGDRLVGGPGDDELMGGPGRDALLGGPGADELSFDGAARLVDGGPGDDHLRSDFGAADHAFGGDGNDTIRIAGRGVVEGGPGDDLIRAAGTMAGGRGDDHIWALGQRVPDVVRCGAGRDVAEVRVGDRVAGDCERVIRR